MVRYTRAYPRACNSFVNTQCVYIIVYICMYIQSKKIGVPKELGNHKREDNNNNDRIKAVV